MPDGRAQITPRITPRTPRGLWTYSAIGQIIDGWGLRQNSSGEGRRESKGLKELHCGAVTRQKAKGKREKMGGERQADVCRRSSGQVWKRVVFSSGESVGFLVCGKKRREGATVRDLPGEAISGGRIENAEWRSALAEAKRAGPSALAAPGNALPRGLARPTHAAASSEPLEPWADCSALRSVHCLLAIVWRRSSVGP